MLKQLCFGLALSLTLLGGTHSSYATESYPQKLEASTLASKSITIPQSTALVVAVPNQVDIDINRAQPTPLMLVLVQPITDVSGQMLIPAQSLVQATLTPSRGGAQIVAEAIIVNGQLLPVSALSPIIPSIEVPMVHHQASSRHNSIRSTSRQGMALGCLVDSFISGACDADSQRIGATAGALLGSFSGSSQPETVRYSSIEPNSLYVLQLQSPVVLK
ncbi:hypothetical protein IQ260_28030 [Leptolyngbya cf. ectocarpi LEGE 11479]|uniref:Uncharacterized protein n=1 Tax=Leptolyngbya cf. ectocarpi LEGE 11479 TaxID=1828722 RepID=A0A928ZZW0_LEPEC|nr:hypothetical protein [Leptolyngbya ectocarpi]MBE9070497.1 hypothetical protein [Leptolyngbya cf. ectocarpi LEGE 11479]